LLRPRIADTNKKENKDSQSFMAHKITIGKTGANG
jgi:hypothetical protein